MTTIPGIKKILYLTDLSENAQQALGYAISLADVYGAEISIFHVIEDVSPNAELVMAAFLGYAGPEELREKSQADVIIQIKNRMAEMCDAIGGQIPSCRFIVKEIRVEAGRPASLIPEHVRKGDYDLLVMGNHGHGAIKEIFAGSTTRKVVHACKKPVLLVPLKNE